MNRTTTEKRNAAIQDATLRSQDIDSYADTQSDQATAGDVDNQSDQATAGDLWQPLDQEYQEYHDSATEYKTGEEELDEAFRACLKRIGVSSEDDETSKSSCSNPSHRLDNCAKQNKETDNGSEKIKHEAVPTAASSSPLPSELVATILEIASTPVHTIMQMGISSKLVVREVLPKLRRLVIWRSKDLDVRMAVKFLSPSKVASIDICCLIALADSSSISSQKYNVGASHKIPFFLSQFPNLKRVYLGGTRRLPVLSMYEPFRCVLPEDHREYHNGMLWALCGAFRSRALSQDLIIDGLAYSGIYCLWSQDRRGIDDDDGNERTSCTFCHAVLDHFPVSMIIRHTVRSRGDSSICFDERQIYERLMNRSEDLVWKALFDDTIEVLRHERPTVVSITPSSATRIVNLCSWDLRPDCFKRYWKEILDGFTCISRTLYMVISFVDGSVLQNRFEIFEDNPRPQLAELLTTNVEDRRSVEE